MIELHAEVEIMTDLPNSKLFQIDDELARWYRLWEFSSTTFRLVDSDGIIPTTDIFYSDYKYFSSGADLNKLGVIDKPKVILPDTSIMTTDLDKVREYPYGNTVCVPYNDISNVESFYFDINSKLSFLVDYSDRNSMNIVLVRITTLMGGDYIVRSTPSSLDLIRISNPEYSGESVNMNMSTLLVLLSKYSKKCSNGSTKVQFIR